MNSLAVRDLVRLLNCLNYRGRDSAIRLQDVMHYQGTQGWEQHFFYSFESTSVRMPLSHVVWKLQYENHIPIEAIIECLGDQDLHEGDPG